MSPRDSPTLEEAYRTTWQALPGDRRDVYDQVVRFILAWLVQGEVDLASIYVAHLRQLQQAGTAWSDAARQAHQEN